MRKHTIQPRNTKYYSIYVGQDKAEKVDGDLHKKGPCGYILLGNYTYFPIALLVAPNEPQNTRGSEWSCNKEIHLTPRNFPIYLNRECFFDTTVTNHSTTLYFMKHPWGAIQGSKASERDAKIFHYREKLWYYFGWL